MLTKPKLILPFQIARITELFRSRGAIRADEGRRSGGVTKKFPFRQRFGYEALLKQPAKGASMFHLIWYLLIGLIAGVIAKAIMHVHLTMLWTTIVGIIGGAVMHMFVRPRNARFHPAGLIFSTLGAIVILYVCQKLNIRFPRM